MKGLPGSNHSNRQLVVGDGNSVSNWTMVNVVNIRLCPISIVAAVLAIAQMVGAV